jgi:hypothetical protein
MDKSFLFNVPKPCSKDWNKMTPHQQGNFCKSCDRLVYDLTDKTDEELQRFFIEKKKEKICGRFKTTQLAAPEKLSIPFAAIPSMQNPLRAFGLALFLVFGTGLFFCTTSSGASVSELKLDAGKKQQADLIKQEIRRTGTHFLMGGWSAHLVPPQGFSVYTPVDPLIYPWATPVPGAILNGKAFDFSALDPDSIFAVMEHKGRIDLPKLNVPEDLLLTVQIGKWTPQHADSIFHSRPITSEPYTYTWDPGPLASPPGGLSKTIGYVVQVSDAYDGPYEPVNHEDSLVVSWDQGELDTTAPELPQLEFNDMPRDTTVWSWDFDDVFIPPQDTPYYTTGFTGELIVTNDEEIQVMVMPEQGDTATLNEEQLVIEKQDEEKSPQKMPAIGPVLFELNCYPNPTYGPFTISYTLNASADIKIDVFDIYGKLVKQVIEDPGLTSGIYTVSENIADLDNGTYFCRMQCGTVQLTQKIILQK